MCTSCWWGRGVTKNSLKGARFDAIASDVLVSCSIRNDLLLTIAVWSMVGVTGGTVMGADRRIWPVRVFFGQLQREKSKCERRRGTVHEDCACMLCVFSPVLFIGKAASQASRQATHIVGCNYQYGSVCLFVCLSVCLLCVCVSVCR